MQTEKTPQHVAIIMDGNRRWARKQGLAIIKGHRKTAEETIERLVDYAIKVGIKFLTLWAFSTENWHREQTEVEGIMNLFRETFDTVAERLHKKGVRVHTIGDLSPFPQDIREGAEHWKEETSKNKKLIVTFALNYGGRDEIVRAINRLMAEKKDSKNQAITAKIFEQYLDTHRGIDLPELSHVIQYEPPEDAEAYIHRSGRTGRAGSSGTAITLVNITEQAELRQIGKRFSLKIEERDLPDDELVEKVVSERIITLLEAKLRSRDKLQTERMQRFLPLARSLGENDEETSLLAMLLDDFYQETFYTDVIPSSSEDQQERQRTSRRPKPRTGNESDRKSNFTNKSSNRRRRPR